ncbi:MAG: proline dehydrogenase family protein [Flavobacteriaceae bacterium]|nr:proline dehydrogenase family protein [Flavobacteriaceae bacterium]
MSKIFDNTKEAFSLKTDAELNKAFYLFEMIKRESLMKIGASLTKMALKANLPIEGIIRATVFDHFCGGISEEDCVPKVKNMHEKTRVHSILDYSVEGKETEEQFDNAVVITLKTIRMAKDNVSMPFAVFKPTGFGRFALYQKITEKKELTEQEKSEWDKVIGRYHTVCKEASNSNIPLLIDAEESWMQCAADELVEEMMIIYNKEKAIVYSTLQMYRWDRLDYLKKLHNKAKDKGFYIGMKLVRGAYMEKERERAKKNGYKSPICKDKQATDDNFNSSIEYMTSNENMSIFLGTHNEESTYLLMDKLSKNNIMPSDTTYWFGQLYGMSDNISFNLSKAGFNVAKYLPFGPVRDVMPYLIRRAEENTSVAGQTTRELDLIKKERKRRKIEE